MTTRDEHVAWAKQRALAELDADPGPMGVIHALASLGADFGNHPDTANHPAILLGTRLAMAGQLDTHQQTREWIGGVR